MADIKRFYTKETLFRIQRESGGSTQLTGETALESDIPSGSFRRDVAGSPLRSTQQLPLDWSDFSNHTFFSSAQTNVNIAFDRIINEFPFDGSPIDAEEWSDTLTGFEKYVFDQFPKYRGSLLFSSSYISVVDTPGGLFPTLSKNSTGLPALDPEDKSICFQFKLKLPTDSNDSSVIVQRLGTAGSYTLGFLSSSSTVSSSLFFGVSGQSGYVSSSAIVPKGRWVDICAQYNRRPGTNCLQIFVDSALASTSSMLESVTLQSRGAQFLIGSGTAHSSFTAPFVPGTTLSASLDEFRVYHRSFTQQEVSSSMFKSASPSDDLKLYFKFNEPTGSYERSSVVIDSSGNGLHAIITNFTESLRGNVDGLPPFRERLSQCPVLFPDQSEVVSLNTRLLTSASQYDSNNPNLITKLIPAHYLIEERTDKGFNSDEGSINRNFEDGGNLPRETKLGSTQIITSLLFIWSKQFDEMKMYIDQFGKLENLDYDETNSIADSFLPIIAARYGFELPNLFSGETDGQRHRGDDIGADPETGIETLAKIQSKIWRRMVATLPEIVRSKGTRHSVESLIRSIGFNPDTTVRLREYGGTRTGFISGRKSQRDSFGVFVSDLTFEATSSYLSGSRIEPGLPALTGTPSDGLFTTSSFTYEANYRFPTSVGYIDPSCLARLDVTGSVGRSNVVNLLAFTSGAAIFGETTLKLLVSSSNYPTIELSLTGANVFNGDMWNVSFMREPVGDTKERWTLRAGNLATDRDISYFVTSSTIVRSSSTDVLSSITPTLNSSGAFLSFGEYSYNPAGSLLNSNQYASNTQVLGEISRIRFWSRELSENEWKEHVRNPTSFGVEDPLTRLNFITSQSGSFGRLRLDVTCDQEVTSSSGGNILLFDFSQGENHIRVGSLTDTNVISQRESLFTTLSPKFDESSSDNKVRVRSWNQYENWLTEGGEFGVLQQIPKNEQPNDDTRFGVEISISQALDEDIMRSFSSHDFFDNAIGDPNLLFSDDYYDLENMRDVYFNRLTGPVNIRNIFNFARWFSTNIGNMIQQLVPSNTTYLGTNFVVESHVLERSKVRYRWGDSYLGENDRRGLTGAIFVGQVVADLKRF